MTTHLTKKNKFSQLNGKRFYFANVIISLPFGQLTLNKIDEYKKEKGERLKNMPTKKEGTIKCFG